MLFFLRGQVWVFSDPEEFLNHGRTYRFREKILEGENEQNCEWRKEPGVFKGHRSTQSVQDGSWRDRPRPRERKEVQLRDLPSVLGQQQA